MKSYCKWEGQHGPVNHCSCWSPGNPKTGDWGVTARHFPTHSHRRAGSVFGSITFLIITPAGRLNLGDKQAENCTRGTVVVACQEISQRLT